MKAKASEIINIIFRLVKDGNINVDDVIEMINSGSKILVAYGGDLTNTDYVKCENDQEEATNSDKPIKIRVSGEIEIENACLLELNKISNSVKKTKDNYKTETNDI